MTPPDLSWLDAVLEKLRCPVTGQPLRHAADVEKQRAGIALSEPALANQAGTHVYPVLNGMPHLLPENARHE